MKSMAFRELNNPSLSPDTRPQRALEKPSCSFPLLWCRDPRTTFSPLNVEQKSRRVNGEKREEMRHTWSSGPRSL